jgi:hypothetical protein
MQGYKVENKINPFNELYRSEAIGGDAFVKLFSPTLVSDSLPIFQPGNVVLRGLQGSGKSMLMNLLKPDVFVAYKYLGEKFPVPEQCRKFIGAGINLTISGATDFSERLIVDDSFDDANTNPTYFADFFNYYIVADIFNSLDIIFKTQNNEIADELGISLDKNTFNKFLNEICKEGCWEGFLRNEKKYPDIREKILGRIRGYRSFFNYNIESIPDEIKVTKTKIGEPIAAIANKLKEFGVIQPETQVYISVDQYEELFYLEKHYENFTTQYRQLIHKVLGSRQSDVSYRIGTRRYSWPEVPEISNSSKVLEKERDFKIIDLDETLRLTESRRGWIYPELVEDVFTRRLKMFGYSVGRGQNLMEDVFGKRLSPEKKVNKYISKPSMENIISWEKDWPKNWKNVFSELGNKSLLSAKLGEAWLRQKGINSKNLVSLNKTPWEMKNKRWWKKERIEQALMQIASKNRQQLNWQGKNDIISLSGGNILIFLSICQHIWDVWIRDTRKKSINMEQPPHIDGEIQSIGILEASTHWYEKISERPGGKERKDFIGNLGSFLYKSMTEDKNMSYPGGNGFSLRLKELNKNEDMKRFLEESENFGDLIGLKHTSKRKGERRWKWYMNQIFSPYFKIPYVHTKEPLYVNLPQIYEWLGEKKKSKKIDRNQLELFS